MEEQDKKLTEALNELRKAKTQLIHSQKMASLGMLTAGIVHEINNAINFIYGGVQAMEENIRELKEQREENKSDKEHLLFSDIEDMLGSMKAGVKRSTEILTGVRSFVRADEKVLAYVRLQDCIDSTLAILNSQLKNNMQVTKHYQPTNPVNCHPSQINQVLLNLLNNAIQSIEEKKVKGAIDISLFPEKDHAVITIKDNGTGIPKAIQDKIFDAFFTTKDVGKGTGLGLSISYNIIKEHHGTISFNTEPGQGTEFIIRLPFEA